MVVLPDGLSIADWLNFNRHDTLFGPLFRSDSALERLTVDAALSQRQR